MSKRTNAFIIVLLSVTLFILIISNISKIKTYITPKPNRAVIVLDSLTKREEMKADILIKKKDSLNHILDSLRSIR